MSPSGWKNFCYRLGKSYRKSYENETTATGRRAMQTRKQQRCPMLVLLADAVELTPCAFINGKRGGGRTLAVSSEGGGNRSLEV
jgi:hypothetical protein